MDPIEAASQRATWPLIVAGLWLTFGLLALVQVPHGALWKARVAATEYGYILALLPLLCLPFLRGSPSAVALSVIASLLLLSSLPRAASRASTLPAELTEAFPGGHLPASAHGAPALATPFSVSALFGLSSPGVEVESLRLEGATGVPQNVDLYRRSGSPKPHPLIVVIHGGSWRNGDQTQLPAINRYLAARGFAVAALTYRLAPAAPYPAAIDDVVAITERLWSDAERYQINPAKTVMLGRSAGGHLALLAAYKLGRGKIRGAIAYYPPTDLLWSWEHPTNPWVLDTPEVIGGFMGGPPEELDAAYREASPHLQLSRAAPPTLLIHGEGDELVFAEQSRFTKAKLDELAVPSFALLLPWATHGCDANLAGPSGQLSTFAIERFLAFALAEPAPSGE
jgi:acetyl esterase/lipase